jgi:lysophospholipid acyltransferase (LPLAT)-like uncharacterized protein
MSLRKRLERSAWLTNALAFLIMGYARFCCATITWIEVGRDELKEDLKNGPIVLILWHSRLFLGPAHWPQKTAKLTTLRDPSVAGRLSAAFQECFGMEPIAMSATGSSHQQLKLVLKSMACGNSLGLTADGPIGPALKAKDHAIDWARISGRPVWLYAFSVKKGIRLTSWDSMLLPKPFTKGVLVYREWPVSIPRNADETALETARMNLTSALNRVQAEADSMLGLPPGS